ncbi:MAG TPA: hypothetical protein VGA95_08065 [Thermodesulfobacteriota bacterium]
MFDSNLGRSHGVEDIPAVSIQVIVKGLIPGIVMLVLLVFTVLMVDFWRCMTQRSNLQKLLLKNGG